MKAKRIAELRKLIKVGKDCYSWEIGELIGPNELIEALNEIERLQSNIEQLRKRLRKKLISA